MKIKIGEMLSIREPKNQYALTIAFEHGDGDFCDSHRVLFNTGGSKLESMLLALEILKKENRVCMDEWDKLVEKYDIEVFGEFWHWDSIYQDHRCDLDSFTLTYFDHKGIEYACIYTID